ncbi:ATP synthase F0 subunit C [bacterium]|nr:MAG: ATP synthase F0 subunit C [bacterium]QQR62090.1 MAG: ATP synthase F0 subunit C [bacterium]QQR63353.1 MAG: ATP synthase F0 subunit C [bacterium]
MDVNNIFYAKAAAFIGSAIAMGLGSIGPALGQGLIGMKACEGLAKEKDPEVAGKIRTTMLIAMAMVETSAIYCLLVALLLLFAGKNMA